LPDQTEIHKDCIGNKVESHKYTADTLRYAFSRLPDKDLAWQYLHRLTLGGNKDERGRAAYAVGSALSHIPDKYRDQAWQDLHRLIQDRDWTVRGSAVNALGSAFSWIPDKDQAWQDLHRLAQDKNPIIRGRAAGALGSAFSWIPDKDQAWQDLHRLAQDKNPIIRGRAAGALGSAFSWIPDKDQAWQDLYRLAHDKDQDTRSYATGALGRAFSKIPSKDQAWQDLHKLTHDEYFDVRCGSARAIGSAFSEIPNKDQAWQDLHRLAFDNERGVRASTVNVLGLAFSEIPDKDQAWQDLHRLAFDNEKEVRASAADSLGLAFSEIPNIDQAWQYLHRLTFDNEGEVRASAVKALGSAFSKIPDKDQAWQDLHRLAHDKDQTARGRAAGAIGQAFSHISNKDQAWQDLHRLAQDKDNYVRRKAAEALGNAFSEIPDKDQAWQDLHKLTQDKESYVRMFAYHSLGKASIYKATIAHDTDIFKKELDIAVAFFEGSSKEYKYGPANFCYPFYRSFLAITFQKAKEDEIRRYLEEAREAVGGSESKALLFEAVENLARALGEIHKYSQSNFKGESWREIQKYLKDVYEPYCNKAVILLDKSERSAPGATKCVRKAIPIISEYIVADIQTKSKAICKAAYGSEILQPIVTDLNREAQELSSKDESECLRKSLRMVPVLQEFCKLLPAEKRGFGCGLVAEIRAEAELPEILSGISNVLTYLQPNIELTAYESANIQIFNDIKKELGVVNSKLDEIRYAIFKQKIYSDNAITNLTAIRAELEKLYQISTLYPNLSPKELYSCREEQLQELSKDLDIRFAELKNILKEKSSTDDIKIILDKLDRLKPVESRDSKAWNIADKGATLLTYISFLNEAIPILRPILAHLKLIG
jgi:HEAT repeat protein